MSGVSYQKYDCEVDHLSYHPASEDVAVEAFVKIRLVS